MAETAPVWKLHLSDGTVIEPMRAYVDGGDHMNVIPWEHAYLHAGDRFRTCNLSTALADNATIDMVFTVGATMNPHMTISVGNSGVCTLTVFESPTGVTVGTANPVFNRNRESTNTSETTVLLNPTIVADGTQIEGIVISGGGAGGNSSGSGGEGRDEFILKRDTLYLYRLTNVAGTAIEASVDFDWYDHLPTGV